MNWIAIPCDISNPEDYKIEKLSIGGNEKAKFFDYTFLIRITHKIAENVEERIGIANVIMSNTLHYAKVSIYPHDVISILFYEDYSLASSEGIDGCLKKQAEKIYRILVEKKSE